MHPNTRHKKLLENVKVRRWYENLEAKSTVTAGVYLRNLGLWMEYLHKDPDNLIEFVKNDFEEFKGQVSDQIRKMERDGIHGASISTSIKPMISFLKFHNVVVRLSLNIKNENRNLNAEKETIPEKYQLRSILLKASLRERVAISLMSFSGLRPEVLGNEIGNDGLRLGDIPDLTWNGDFDIRIPARIDIRAELSKTRLPYFTFLGKEGCDYLLDYLRSRKKNGENLTPQSPAILPENEKSYRENPSEFLRTNLIGRRIKKAISKAGFEWRPYIFRAYFGTNLDSSEAKGYISHPQRQFIMGHKGDIEEAYTKRRSEVKVDEIRDAYTKCLTFLETEKKEITEDELETKFRTQLLLMAGFSEKEINEKHLLDMTAEEITKLARDKLFSMQKVDISDQIQKDKQEMNGSHKQKVVSLDLIEEYINSGFVVKMALGNDKAIVELP